MHTLSVYKKAFLAGRLVKMSTANTDSNVTSNVQGSKKLGQVPIFVSY